MKGISSPPTTDFAKLKDVVVFNGQVVSSDTWQDLDLSAYVGANAALCYFEILPGNNVDIYMKPKGYGDIDASDHDLNNVSSDAITTDRYAYLLCFTNDAGIIEIAADSDSVTISIKLVGLIK